MNVFKSTEARPMPGRSTGPVAWFRANLFSSVGNSLLSVLLLAVEITLEAQSYNNAVWIGPELITWECLAQL